MPDIFVAPTNEDKPKTEEKPTEPVVEETPSVEEPLEQQGGSLSAFVLNPDNVHFDTQTEEEKIVLLLRKHWLTNLPWLMIAFVLIFAPPLVFPAAVSRGFLPFLPANFILILGLFWLLFSFGFVLVNFIVWYFNVYIVTNERIIDVDFYHLLYKKLSSTRINNIQDITYHLGGVARAIFDFGDVLIQTAGTQANFEFEAVPHPEAVVRKINQLMKEAESQPL